MVVGVGLDIDASGQTTGLKMKTREWGILVAALSAFFANGGAFGQAPSQGSGAGEPLSDQQASASEPVAARKGEAGPEPRPSASAVPLTPSSRGNPLWAIPLESLRNTRERPLFSASRRPPPPPQVATAPKVSDRPAQPAAPDKPQITLVGVVRGLGVQMGIFVDQTDQSSIRLRVGQSVRGWTVHDVDPRAATVEKAEQQVKLELPGRNTVTAATSPATEETAVVLTGPSGPIHGTPVGRIKPFATADRYK